MKTGLLLSALFLASTAMPLFAADSDFCVRHCSAEKLRKEISMVKKSIGEARAAANKPSSDKLATLVAEKEKAKKHLAQHEEELKDLMTQLESIEVK